MYRVLRSHGKAVIIDMRRDVSDEVIHKAIKALGLGRMDSLMMKWIFKCGLKQTAYTKNQFKDFISKAQFRMYDIRGSEDLIGFEIWLEK